jgi:PPP family 3-phenylpropionic acid transporter
VLERLGAASAIWLIVAGAVLTTAAAHSLQRAEALGPAEAPATKRLEPASALGLLRSRAFLLFLLATGAVQAAHAVLYTFGTLHWRALGHSTQWCGALWAISIVAEVALFTYSAAAVKRAGALGLVALGAGASIMRWLVMGFDPPLALLVPLQVLHGLTYGAAHLGAIHYMARAVPDMQAGTAQALYAAVTGGIGMGGAMLLAGPLYASYAGRAYWAMAAFGTVSLLANIVLMRSRPHKALA